MAKTNGWGLVGTGRIADDRILPGINACEGNKLIGVVQPRPGSRERVRREVRCAARLYELRGDAAQSGGDGGGDTHAQLAARRPGRRSRPRRQARVLRQADGDERAGRRAHGARVREGGRQARGQFSQPLHALLHRHAAHHRERRDRRGATRAGRGEPRRAARAAGSERGAPRPRRQGSAPPIR